MSVETEGVGGDVWAGLEAVLSPPNYSEDSSIIYKTVDMTVRALATVVLLPGAFISSVFSLIGRLTENVPKGFAAVAKCSELWDTIQVGNLNLPPLIGTATSEYQYSGIEHCPNNQWAQWERENLPMEEQSGKACDLWNRPAEIVAILQKLGLNTFRFSVEWSKIEPKEGVIDLEALTHYVEFCKMLKDGGIEPMVTLHHFTEPLWFSEKGGFEKEENIGAFVNFSRIIFEALSRYVGLWCSINEPGIVAFSGYILGHFPPNKTDLALSAEVLKNLLKAHCAVYRELKPLRPDAQIGIVHQGLRFTPYRLWNPLEVLAASYLTRMTHDVIMEFLSSGVFDYKIPFQVNNFFVEREIEELNDFIGVNCYARPLIKQVFGWEFMISTHYPHEEMTEMEFREDPAAIYEMLKEVHEKTGKPIYVTETGISTLNEEQYKRYMERALYSISQAIEEGADVQGIYVWSLMKNFEWNMGWGHNFGICDQEGNLRKGAQDLQIFENVS